MTQLQLPCTFKAVGVTFVPGYPGNLLSALEAADDAQAAGEGLSAVLIRNPQNQYDANAIEIHVPALGGMVGHVPAAIAERLAPELDAGATHIRAEVVSVLVTPGKSLQPGISFRLERIKEEGAEHS